METLNEINFENLPKVNENTWRDIDEKGMLNRFSLRDLRIDIFNVALRFAYLCLPDFESRYADSWCPRFVQTNKRIMIGNDVIVLDGDTFDIDNNGLCLDEDPKLVRILRHTDNGDVVRKTKVAKLFNECYGEFVPERTLKYLCETISMRWTVQNLLSKIGDIHLVVDDDFEYLYDEGNYAFGSFGSCMEVHYDEVGGFYKELGFKAASIRNSDNEIYARCVIVPDAKDKDGKIYRLAERQYAANGNIIVDGESHKISCDSFRIALIRKLIDEGYIDGFKKPCAGCSEGTAFVLNDGTELGAELTISDCGIDSDHYFTPYMDSFKYWYVDDGVMSNIEDKHKARVCLHTTNGEPEIFTEYDKYHDMYCYRVISVYVWDSSTHSYTEMTCDEECLEDFEEYNGSYYDELGYSDILGRHIPLGQIEDEEQEWFDENRYHN